MEFNSSIYGASSEKIVTICIRVSVDGGKTYSYIKLVNIKPDGPTFELEADNPCPDKNGRITIYKIVGRIPGDEYRCVVSDKGVQDGDQYIFKGTSLVTRADYSPGDYQVKLYSTDATLGNCSVAPVDITIVSLPDMDFDATPTNVTCPGDKNGKIEVKETSSWGSYQFILGTESLAIDKNGEFVNLGVGTHIVKATDQCHQGKDAVMREVVIKEPSEVQFSSISKVDPNCRSNPNGSISISISGGQYPGKTDRKYIFLVKHDSKEYISPPVSLSQYTFNILEGGNFTVQAKTEQCPWKISDQVQKLTPVEPMVISLEYKKDLTCFNENKGEIKVSASGGFKPYTYYLNETSSIDGKFVNLPASTSHNVTVQSASYSESCNDIASISVPISSPPDIAISAKSIEHVACNGESNGWLETIVNGGSGGYTCGWQIYNQGDNKWYDVDNVPDNSFNIYDRMSGLYKINVKDVNSCEKSKEFEITQPDVLNITSVTPRDVICFGENGFLDIAAQGGTKAYKYICMNTLGGGDINGPNSSVSVPAGDYYVKVTDAHGCETTYCDSNDDLITTVTKPDSKVEFTMSSPLYSGFNIPCSGDRLGEISVEAWGGNGYDYDGYSYSISGSPYQGGQTFTGLPAGTFNIRVKDGRGCIVEQPYTLTEPDPLLLTVLPTQHVKCFGEPTGRIMVTPTGGIADTFKYKLDGTEMPEQGIFENLYAGIYNVEVYDKNSCRYNVSETVNHLYPPINIVMFPEDVRCYNEGNGKINTVVTGGSGGFTYFWDLKDGDQWNPLDGITDNRTNLVPGYYRIKATDSENCILYSGVQINEPEEFIIPEAISKDIVCLGEKGSINITATGGNGENKYFCREKEGSVFQSNDPLFNLPAGFFTVDAADKKGCLAAFASGLTITEPLKALDFSSELSSYTGYGVSCNGKSDGIVIFEASGGNDFGYTGYKYSVSGSPFDNNNYFTGLPKGSHILRVTDGRGCIVEKTIGLTEPPEISVNVLHSKPVTCFGKPTGEVAVEASGGIQNSYTYKTDGKEFTSGVFTGLYAGTHSISVTDMNGCSEKFLTTVIHKNPAINTNLSSLSVKCSGEDNGQIISNITGGAGSFSINWEKKDGKTWKTLTGTNDRLDNLVAGFYRIKARDSEDCIVYDSIEVSEPERLIIKEVSIKDAACFNDMGSFNIQAEGGNDGYAFYCSADNALSFNSYSSGDPIPPGSYRLKVSDSKGCFDLTPGEYTITKPESPLAFEYSTSDYSGFNISCHGNDDGSIDIKATGGNSGTYRGYTYSLSGSPETRENSFAGLEAGNYEVAVTDARGCRIVKTVPLTEPESEISLKASSFKRPLCVYDKTGEVVLNASGGTQPYKYSANSGFYSTSPEFTGLPARKYTFRVKDINGCAEILDTTIVSIETDISISSTITDVGCFGEKSGRIELSLTGGSGPYTYSWKDYPSFKSKATDLGKGNYSVSVTDAAGCKSERSFEVRQPASPLSINATSGSACAETKNGVIYLAANGGTPPYRYAALSKADFSAASSFASYPGAHKAFATDANNCLVETLVNVEKKNTMPDVNFITATSRYEFDTLVILDVSVPAPDKIKWEFSNEAAIIDTVKGKAKIKYNQSGIYPVKMTGLFGTCSYTIEKLLNIAPFDPLISGNDKNIKGIKSVKISPNPNDGRFELKVGLYSKEKIIVKIFDFNSRLVYNETFGPETEFTEQINLPESTMPGTYILWILTENDSNSSFLIISK
ncbi:MAG TPA: hypothetical protein VHO46_15205 [Bacteroidales bacterium]|nr:hypothetical protein [Bacteroidales bacterium]